MPNMSTKEKIVAVALDLFHENGINATSVDDILEASATGKSSKNS
ncbi:MAG: TetR family transcriptional regulator [Proteobacteria bacterium]|nr:TetR family transcriptional regulator [Pseudomonadota bacterium]